MGWLDRIFGKKEAQSTAAPASGESIAPERVGLNGEYDQSGLAKRVAQAFDNEASLTDIETLWVAQTSSTVVLKGEVPSQDILARLVAVAEKVNGATNVDTSQVTVTS